MEDLKLQLITDKNDQIIIRTGNALPAKEPNRIDIIGNIHAVSDYLKIRTANGSGYQSLNNNTAIVMVDKENLTIQLLLDPENYYGASVTAKLLPSKEILPFAINSNKTFTREEMVKLIRFNKIFFESAEKHTELLQAYQSFTAKTNAEIKQESDLRGNKTNNFSKQVETKLPDNFILNIPIFNGFEPSSFRVEIALDVTDGGARFWFESIELHELKERLVNTAFESELQNCHGLVIIQK